MSKKKNQEPKHGPTTWLWGVQFVDNFHPEDTFWIIEPGADEELARNEFNRCTKNGTEDINKQGLSYYELVSVPRSP